MNFRLGLLAIPVALSACGSYAPNSNASSPINVVGSSATDTTGVAVANSAPATAIELSGIDCRNKLWNPTPTSERAIDVLKGQVKKAGLTKVKVTSVDAIKSPLGLNCWSAMEARGLAY